MADKDTSNSNVPEMQRYEHRRKNVGAKAVVVHGYDANTDSYFPITATDNGDGTYSIKTSTSAIAAYSWQATSDDGTYKYFFFEDASLNYYIMRKHKTNKVATYTKGTGGYTTVYVSSSAGPSGSPTWASYGTVF